jgi:hypothetical protein
MTAIIAFRTTRVPPYLIFLKIPLYTSPAKFSFPLAFLQKLPPTRVARKKEAEKISASFLVRFLLIFARLTRSLHAYSSSCRDG